MLTVGLADSTVRTKARGDDASPASSSDASAVRSQRLEVTVQPTLALGGPDSQATCVDLRWAGLKESRPAAFSREVTIGRTLPEHSADSMASFSFQSAGCTRGDVRRTIGRMSIGLLNSVV